MVLGCKRETHVVRILSRVGYAWVISDHFVLLTKWAEGFITIPTWYLIPDICIRRQQWAGEVTRNTPVFNRNDRRTDQRALTIDDFFHWSLISNNTDVVYVHKLSMSLRMWMINCSDYRRGGACDSVCSVWWWLTGLISFVSFVSFCFSDVGKLPDGVARTCTLGNQKAPCPWFICLQNTVERR